MATTSKQATPVFVTIGRIFLALAFFSMLGAWLSQLMGGSFLGLTPQHFFYDSIAMSLLGIGAFVDAFWHSRNL